jgi:hypothetical protein
MAGTAAAARPDSRARRRSAGTPAGSGEFVRRWPPNGRPRRWTDPVAEGHRRGARWGRRQNGRRSPPPRSVSQSSRARWSIARRRWRRPAAADTRTNRREEVDGPRDGSVTPARATLMKAAGSRQLPITPSSPDYQQTVSKVLAPAFAGDPYTLHGPAAAGRLLLSKEGDMDHVCLVLPGLPGRSDDARGVHARAGWPPEERVRCFGASYRDQQGAGSKLTGLHPRPTIIIGACVRSSARSSCSALWSL